MAIVKHNQTLFDVAILNDGYVSSALDWAFANGISITDDLEPNRTLINPDALIKQTEMVDFFKFRDQNIGTGINVLNTNEELFGFPNGFPISF
jgi:hypothetical protein